MGSNQSARHHGASEHQPGQSAVLVAYQIYHPGSSENLACLNLVGWFKYSTISESSTWMTPKLLNKEITTVQTREITRISCHTPFAEKSSWILRPHESSKSIHSSLGVMGKQLYIHLPKRGDGSKLENTRFLREVIHLHGWPSEHQKTGCPPCFGSPHLRRWSFPWAWHPKFLLETWPKLAPNSLENGESDYWTSHWDMKMGADLFFFLLDGFLFFSLGHVSLLFATFWSKNLYFAEFWS